MKKQFYSVDLLTLLVVKLKSLITFFSKVLSAESMKFSRLKESFGRIL